MYDLFRLVSAVRWQTNKYLWSYTQLYDRIFSAKWSYSFKISGSYTWAYLILLVSRSYSFHKHDRILSILGSYTFSHDRVTLDFIHSKVTKTWVSKNFKFKIHVIDEWVKNRIDITEIHLFSLFIIVCNIIKWGMRNPQTGLKVLVGRGPTKLNYSGKTRI